VRKDARNTLNDIGDDGSYRKDETQFILQTSNSPGLCPLKFKAQFERDPKYAHSDSFFQANDPLFQGFYEPSRGRSNRNHSR
jgi:hypothetical protein